MDCNVSRRLLIVWFSRTGACEQLAAQAAQGAATADEAGAAEVLSLNCTDAGPEHLLAAGGYLFVCPENLASMAGAMKEFFDRSYYPVLDRLNGRPYAQIVAAGSDGQGAVRQIARIATGLRLRAVAEPLIVMMHAQSAGQILAPKRIDAADAQRARELGSLLAQGLSAGIW